MTPKRQPVHVYVARGRLEYTEKMARWRAMYDAAIAELEHGL